jgi:hypothetical protein
MQRLFLHCLLWISAASCLEAQNNSSQADGTRIVFTSISGQVRNAVFYAPNPMVPPAALQQHPSGRAVYKIDLDNGILHVLCEICEAQLPRK